MKNDRSENVHPIAEIGLTEIDGEPRARDLDLADRLGFERPRKIRELIERNISEIETLGPSPRRGAMVDIGSGATRAVEEYWLNEEQALLVAILSKAPKAPAVRAMLIKVFVAWRRGHLDATAALDEKSRSVIGGIVKSIVHSQLATILPMMVESAMAADARRAVLDYASVRQLLEEAGAVQKGRKSLNRRIGHRLGLIARGEGGARRCPHTATWLYPRIMADRFMREEGAGLVKEHNDRVSGQGVLKLVLKKAPEGWSDRPL
jgi:hypothetical protein